MRASSLLLGLAAVLAVSSAGTTDAAKRSRYRPLTASGRAIAPCADSMRGIGIPPGQRPTKARGSFGIFEFAPDFRRLPRFRNNLLRNKAPVGVTGDVPVTLTVLKSARHRIALGYANRGGSRSRYAEIEFRPCPHKARTTWAGGLLLRDRQPVTLLVSMAGGEPARLRLGRPRRLIAAPSARRAVPPARYRSNQVVRIARIAAGQISLAR